MEPCKKSFVNQFEKFFQGFIGNVENESLKRTRRPKTTKKFTMFTEATTTENEVCDFGKPEEEEDEEKVFLRKVEKKLTYHHRKKKKIEDKIDGIGSRPNNSEKKLRKIEMLDIDKGESVE